MERGPATKTLLLSETPLPELVIEARPRLDLLTSNDTLASVRDWLAVRSARDVRGALRGLFDAISPYADQYDYILIDCGPGLDILTMNALLLAHQVLVPVSVDFLSAAGTSQHLETIGGLREMGGRAEISYVVPTMFDTRTTRSHEILEILKRAFGDLVTEPIRSNTRLAEAPHTGQTIFERDPGAIGADDYEALVWVVINKTTGDRE
jgi:chromosome partitioning protein